MPYELKDGAALPGLHESEPLRIELSPSGGAILDEMQDQDAAATLGKLLKELRHPIQVAARELADEAETTLLGIPGVKAVQGSARDVKAAWMAYSASERQLANNPNLTARGRDEANERNAEKRDDAIRAAAQKGPSSGGDSVLDRFPERPVVKLSVELASEISLVFSAFPHTSVRGFISETLEVLRTATAPRTSESERDRLNQMLRRGYGPLTTRRALHPEKFAKALQSVSQELDELIQLHLSVVDQHVAHELAVQWVADARQQFTGLVNLCRQSGSWDDFIMPIAVPLFGFGQE